ncbi:S-adenosylmethionine sensor upstream of TORC1 [Oratosquilla oratoria]|uniref:S-adenosylmethionine sensor upstream of TORC1 n=1 Tax=Oratosquilla oratoria TaxID=337810 RepID=UPI003F7647F3
MTEQEATSCQSLANIVKRTHKKLRRRYKQGENEDKIWDEHLQIQEDLQQYADAMKELATNHWSKNPSNISRVEWVYQSVMDYFCAGVMHRNQAKEKRKRKHFEETEEDEQDSDSVGSRYIEGQKLKILDVGSCYNPFAEFEEFDVMAIDICPAIKSVKKSDFLKLVVHSEDCNCCLTTSSIEIQNIDSLPTRSFDVVVFSLLLEYLPSPVQRQRCCAKAYELLRPNGILCIVTPDSKHQNANVHLYKLWMITLEYLGFTRTKYEKLKHLHGMIFRKALYPNLWVMDADRQLEIIKKTNVKDKFDGIDYDKISEVLYIPQDFQDASDNEEEEKKDLKIEEETNRESGGN